MEHKCDESNLIIIKEEGMLTSYKCPICGKEFSEIGTIAISNAKNLLRCQIYMEWSKNISLTLQIHTLKKLIPSVKTMDNSILLEAAKKNECIKVAELYLSEGYELLERSKIMGITLRIV